MLPVCYLYASVAPVKVNHADTLRVSFSVYLGVEDCLSHTLLLQSNAIVREHNGEIRRDPAHLHSNANETAALSCGWLASPEYIMDLAHIMVPTR